MNISYLVLYAAMVCVVVAWFVWRGRKVGDLMSSLVRALRKDMRVESLQTEGETAVHLVVEGAPCHIALDPNRAKFTVMWEGPSDLSGALESRLERDDVFAPSVYESKHAAKTGDAHFDDLFLVPRASSEQWVSLLDMETRAALCALQDQDHAMTVRVTAHVLTMEVGLVVENSERTLIDSLMRCVRVVSSLRESERQGVFGDRPLHEITQSTSQREKHAVQTQKQR